MAKRRSRKNGGYISSVTAAICLTLFLFALAVVLVLNAQWLYRLDMKWLRLEETAGMSAERIMENYRALIAYNRVWNRAPLVFPSLAMSATGAIHFQEVKRIFDAVQILCAAGGILSLLFMLQLKGAAKRRALRLAGTMSLVIPAVLGALAALDWDRFFVTFHHLFFKNDYWLFDPATDPVILILPDTYFLHCAAGILILIVLGSILCFLFAGRRRRR